MPDRAVYTLKFQNRPGRSLTAFPASKRYPRSATFLTAAPAGRVNGNFHVSEFTRRPSNPTRLAPSRHRLSPSSAIADYEQNGNDTAKSCTDGNPPHLLGHLSKDAGSPLGGLRFEITDAN